MKALLIIATEGFQDQELKETKDALESQGIVVTIAAKNKGICKGKLGGTAQAMFGLSEILIDRYDGFVFIGGPGATMYIKDSAALRIARDAHAKRKVLGAICIAPSILAAAGALKDRKATVWNEDGSLAPFLAKSGAKYTGDAVTVDGLCVTANGPAASTAFGLKLAELLKKRPFSG